MHEFVCMYAHERACVCVYMMYMCELDEHKGLEVSAQLCQVTSLLLMCISVTKLRFAQQMQYQA